PSFLIFKVDVRCCPPISYSHFHFPTGSTALSSAAPARPHTPMTNASERIDFMIASEMVAQRKQSNADSRPPLAKIVSVRRPVVRSMSAETDNSQRSRAVFGLSRPVILAIGIGTTFSLLRPSVDPTARASGTLG